MDQILGILPGPGIQMKGEKILYIFLGIVPVQESN